jgi:mannose-6-phosphate isomerase
MDVLRPVVRPYAWGSVDAIAELTGRPVPAPGPEAELWMGAHPGAPSGVDRDGVHRDGVDVGGRRTTLDEVIAADPDRELGRGCVARFGPRLPFLLKVLSAARALSIQVHPSRAQAQAGFQAENERGLATDDPARNYTDDWPKPELLYALTPFEVLAGLRSPADAAQFLQALEVGQLNPLAAQLEAASSPQVLADVLGTILSWPRSANAAQPSRPAQAPRPAQPANAAQPSRSAQAPRAAQLALVGDVVAACARLAAGGGPYSAAAAAAVRIASDHPGDLGVVASLLLRHAVLEPGQAVFLAAGGLHAYLKGTGIELLANSDNVVRAGLTGKHLDVPELLALLDPSVEVPVLAPRTLADGIAWFDTPAPEFRLYLVDLVGNTVTLPGEGPRVMLCTDGSAVLRSESGQRAEIGRGGSCFVSAADSTVSCTGQAHLFLAAPGPTRQNPPAQTLAL